MTPPPAPRPAGHALVEALLAQGVDTCFGVPGESYLTALDGFHEHRDRIRFIACRHESGAAFMADAQGKLSGRPGVCFVSRGPGATNASIGIHTAFQDSTPLVVFIGQVASAHRDREAFQEIDYGQMLGPGTLGLAKWVGEVPSADRVPEYVARAFATAQNGRQGPAVVVLPEDVLAAPTAAGVLPRVAPARSAPSPAALVQVERELRDATRPIVIVGGSGWTAVGTAALEGFAEQWQLPVACAFRFQDVFDNRHANYAGDVGIGVDPRLARRIRDADLVLALGPRLGEITSGGYTLIEAPRPRQRLVHVHAGAEELGRVYAADVLVHSSPDEAAEALAGLEPPDTPTWIAHTRAAHADHLANLVPTPVSPLDLAEVVMTMQRLAPADTIYANGAGNFTGWLHRFNEHPPLHRAGRTQLAPTAGAMGYGVPAAVAAAILHPDRLVVNWAGDGDFLMTGAELATAMAQGVRRLVCVVVDNGSYGTIRMHQEREHPGRVSGSELHNPDFAALARAYGLAADTITDTEQFAPALGRAIESERPTLLHLRLDPEISTSRATLTQLRSAATS